VVFSICLATSNLWAAQCPRTSAEQDRWVGQRVDGLIRAARASYQTEAAQPAYERVVNATERAIRQCHLGDAPDFVSRYPEFVEYMRLLSLGQRDDHELGFEVSDKQYFAETSVYTTIPEFLVAPGFLRSVSRFESLPRAKAMLREMNARRSSTDQLLFFSYESRHLGTPDNLKSYLRLLIVVPGDPAQHIPEKWVQFGIADHGKPGSVRNVSVVAVVPAADQTSNVYFKDYFRTYRRNGSIAVKGRWEMGEGDDSCVRCHKSGVLPIFPVANSVSREERALVETVNKRFQTYLPSRFDRYLDTRKFGPGLGSSRDGGDVFPPLEFEAHENQSKVAMCSSCHQPNGIGSLNWPMESTIIRSFVKGGQMPLNASLPNSQRAQLYKQLVDDYFAIDEVRPGILKAWLLGRGREYDMRDAIGQMGMTTVVRPIIGSRKRWKMGND
jgi:hypothetical protein